MRLNDELIKVKGIGEKKYNVLKSMNLFRVNDLIYNFPRTYIDRSKIKCIEEILDNELATVLLRVEDIIEKNSNYKKNMLKLICSSKNFSRKIEVIFFNSKFLKVKFKIGGEYYFFGKILKSHYIVKMIHPEFIKTSENTKKFLRIEPIYSLTNGINNREMIKIYEYVINNIDLKENLPVELVEKNKLCDRNFAFKNINFPNSRENFKKSRYRLIYEEFFKFVLSLSLIKNKVSVSSGISMIKYSIDEFIEVLPFKLTESQLTVWNEILNDLISEKQMNRLLEGDVGSGKTVIAMLSMYFTYKNDMQSILMVPTSVLAKQHYKNFIQFFSKFDVKITLLTSETKKKQELYSEIKDGNFDIVIGTHAILEDDVKFKNLGLIITDEQHRFGVNQREKLLGKEKKANILVMSATPIPRTLALILYGDLDISIIDVLPSGRKSIKTYFISKNKISKMYEFIREQINLGRQAYFVCPLIDESEVLKVKSALELYKELKDEIYKEFNIAVLYGKINPDEKESIMEKFSNGKINILVSTTVIEVGINVPNATIMVITSANRFGLSQLHQLRGRVGRGNEQSYCFLTAENLGEVAKERIKTMVESTDGFKIAEMDLKLRGSGELLGTRQHGDMEFKIANIIKHKKILSLVQNDVKDLINCYNRGANVEYIKEFIETNKLDKLSL